MNTTVVMSQKTCEDYRFIPPVFYSLLVCIQDGNQMAVHLMHKSPCCEVIKTLILQLMQCSVVMKNLAKTDGSCRVELWFAAQLLSTRVFCPQPKCLGLKHYNSPFLQKSFRADSLSCFTFYINFQLHFFLFCVLTVATGLCLNVLCLYVISRNFFFFQDLFSYIIITNN